MSPNISVPGSPLRWSGKRARGAVLHGQKDSGGDIAKGQLGTRPRNHDRGAEAEEGCRWGKHVDVTFRAFPKPGDKAN